MLFFLSFILCHHLSFEPQDPLFRNQFYLKNDGSLFGGLAGEDHNVPGAWDQGFAGENVTIVIIGDGCQMNHSEISSRFDMNLSWNYDTNSHDPSYDPRQFILDYGTKQATIAAGENNDICGIGIAYKSTISCVNVLSATNAQKKYNEGIKRNSNIEHTIRLFPAYSTCNGNVCYISSYNRNDENFFQKAKAIFVTSVQGVMQINDDTAYGQYTGIPYILTFAEISQRGARTVTSIRGNSILASVVTGGNIYDSTTAKLSAYIATGDGFGSTCSKTVFPFGMGGSIAAGIVSLILSANPTLERNDITAIIAFTSVRNDPYSTSWKTNEAGIKYSDVYGFGRLDANASVKMAQEYVHQDLAEDETVNYNGKPLVIPSFFSGYFDVALEFTESKITYIDFIELEVEFSGDISDYSLFRIFVVSPSGTSRMVKDISYIIEPSIKSYRIAIRDFFGENPLGVWKIRFLRENIGPNSYILQTVSLTATGYEKALPYKQCSEQGQNPFNFYEKGATLKTSLPSNQITCNQLFNFSIDIDQDKYDKNLHGKVPFDLMLAPNPINHNNIEYERFGISASNASEPQLAAVYCHYKPGNYKLRAINPIYQMSTQDLDVELINPHEEPGFGPENQYRKFEYTPNQILSIPISLFDTRTKFSPYKRSYFVLATLYDYENKTIYGTQLTLSIGGYYLYQSDHYCPKCILTVVPFENDYIDECNTFMNALSIVEPGQDAEKFEIKWNDVCPLPKGIYTPAPVPTSQFTPTSLPTDVTFPPTATYSATPDSNQDAFPTYIIIIIVVSTIVVVGLIIFIIFWQVKKKILIDKGSINHPLIAKMNTIES